MRLKNKTLTMSEQSLVKLKSQDLPVKVAYKLNKNIKAISERLRFINEHRKDFIEKYGRPDENGVFYIPSEDHENVDKFMKDYTELLEIEDEIEIIAMTLDELESAELSSDDLEAISFLIDERGG
jgi:hypothetical protein